MTAVILQFARLQPAEKATEGPRYFCTRCDSGKFTIFQTGAVHCWHCSARMSNLSASENGRPAA